MEWAMKHLMTHAYKDYFVMFSEHATKVEMCVFFFQEYPV